MGLWGVLLLKIDIRPQIVYMYKCVSVCVYVRTEALGTIFGDQEE